MYCRLVIRSTYVYYDSSNRVRLVSKLIVRKVCLSERDSAPLSLKGLTSTPGFSWLALVPNWTFLLSRQPSFVVCYFLGRSDCISLLPNHFSIQYCFICFFTLQFFTTTSRRRCLVYSKTLGSVFVYLCKEGAHYWSNEKDSKERDSRCGAFLGWIYLFVTDPGCRLLCIPPVDPLVSSRSTSSRQLLKERRLELSLRLLRTHE